MVEHKLGLAFRTADLSASGIFKEIQAEVVFGTPSKHCAGAGICMVSVSGFNSRIISCPRAPVWISSDHPDSLLFRFEKSCLQTAIAHTYFRCREFMVEERFRLPLRAARKMGLSSVWVLPGNYLLSEEKNDWLVRFALR